MVLLFLHHSIVGMISNCFMSWGGWNRTRSASPENELCPSCSTVDVSASTAVSVPAGVTTGVDAGEVAAARAAAGSASARSKAQSGRTFRMTTPRGSILSCRFDRPVSRGAEHAL